MGGGANSKDNQASGLTKGDGGIMAQLENRLQELGPDRLESFFAWISNGEWEAKPLHRVKLRGKKVKTSITMSEALLDAATSEAEKQGFTMGVSSLLEFVLWDFLGRPAHLVEEVLKRARKVKSKRL